MTSNDRDYVARWAKTDHDGLTAANIRGAVILGFLTNDAATGLLGSDTNITTVIDTTPPSIADPTTATSQGGES